MHKSKFLKICDKISAEIRENHKISIKTIKNWKFLPENSDFTINFLTFLKIPWCPPYPEIPLIRPSLDDLDPEKIPGGAYNMYYI